MAKLISFFLVLIFLVTPVQVLAQDQVVSTPTTYFTGKVVSIDEQQTLDSQKKAFIQKVSVQREDTAAVVQVTMGSGVQPLRETQLLSVGDRVVLAEQQISLQQKEVVFFDIYRIPTIIALSLSFIALVLVVGKLQGLSSLIGMVMSVFFLMTFIVPHILAGDNPVTVSLIGCFIIGGVTLYVSHGFHIKSHLALGSMLATLLFVSALSYISVHTARLFGLGQEEAYYLQFGDTAKINLQGLLLGGIMLGALGVLDDITVAQVSIIFQLRALKKDISWKELYERGTHVGKDHVASLVNTLVLAYAGANLPLFLLFITNNKTPQWVTLNSEIIVEEIVRTLTGSMGLVIAVPFATFIAAMVAVRMKPEKIDALHHH